MHIKEQDKNQVILIKQKKYLKTKVELKLFDKLEF